MRTARRVYQRFLLGVAGVTALSHCGPILIPRRPASHSTAALSQIERPEVTAKARPIPGFMRGINLGNGLDAPSEGAWGVVLGERHFEMAAAAGLDHVRLPVRFSAHAEHEAPYTVEAKFFARVDWAIQQAVSRRLSIIVDLHHYEEIMKQPEQHSARFLGIWAQIARRYRNQPPTVAFELLNEPSDKLDSAKLNPLMSQAIQLVRATNPTRLVFVDGYFWANAEYLHQLELPGDPNVIPSFHMYQPILFTHQGADWMEPEFQTRGVVFPGPPVARISPVLAAQQKPWTREWFEAYSTLPVEQNPSGPSTVFLHFTKAEQYVKKTGKRMYLGEFGAIDHADPGSRLNYIKLVREEAERYGFGWAYWDDGGKNKGIDVVTGAWVPVIEAALLDRAVPR
jgi:endoglucanase